MINLPFILKDKYKVIVEIGNGAYGKVYLAEDQNDPTKKYAIKRISKEKISGHDGYLKEALVKELEIMKICACENSILLVEDFESSTNHNIVMELCDNDLDFVLNKRPRGFSEDELKIILLHLKNVFLIMDQKNIIHRDLKLKNIMVTFRNKNEDPITKYSPRNFIVKLADFGFSKFLENDITSTRLGTPATMAPEVLENQSYSIKADIWSMGVIIYQLLFKILPFPARNEQELKNKIKNANGFKIPENYSISKVLEDLLRNLLQKDIKMRYNWKQLFNHEFFKNKDEIFYKIGEKDLYKRPEPDNFNQFEEKYTNSRKLSDDGLDFNTKRAQNRITKEYVLIKEISKEKIFSNKIYEKILYKEINLMRLINSKHFIKFIEFYESTTNFFIITENFTGQILENFLNKRKYLSESLVKKIIRNICPIFKYIDDNDILLEFLSPKSFCFKSFNNEDDFEIKLFDFGLSSIFLNEYERRNYMLLDTDYGNVTSKKANVLSFGMLMYKLLFGETIYKFSSNQDPREATNKATIKLPRNISTHFINLLEKTCYHKIEKRYDWKNFLEDNFVKKIISVEKKKDHSGSSQNISNQIKIEDEKIEKIGDLLIEKINFVYDYYNNLLLNNNLEISEYSKYLKEISLILHIYEMELSFFIDFLKTKKSINQIVELNFIVLKNNNKYEYQKCNFLKDNVIFNIENPLLDIQNKQLSNLKEKIECLIKFYSEKISFQQISPENIEKNSLRIEIPQKIQFITNTEEDSNKIHILKKSNSLTSTIEGLNLENFVYIEKYLFDIIQNGIIYFSRNEFNKALPEFIAAKYLIEQIIFIRLINKKSPYQLNNEEKKDSFNKEDFLNILNVIDLDNELNIFYEDTFKEEEMFSNIRKYNNFLFTFNGGFYKNFQNKNIIFTNEILENDFNSKENKDPIQALIDFYKVVCNFIAKP